MMSKTTELSQDLCNLIVAKHADGIGYRRISKLVKVPVKMKDFRHACEKLGECRLVR